MQEAYEAQMREKESKKQFKRRDSGESVRSQMSTFDLQDQQREQLLKRMKQGYGNV